MNDSGIKPVGDRILVKPEAVETKTEGGIIIPDTEVEKYAFKQTFGELVAIGADSWSDYSEPFASVGDRVLYSKYGGSKFVGSDGNEYLLLNDIDITAVVTGDLKFDDLTPRKKL